MPNSTTQELMTDWTPRLGSFGGSLRRDKDNMDIGGSPYRTSPHGSPTPQGQTLFINTPHSTSHLAYPSISGSPFPHVPHHRHLASPLSQSQNYYPSPHGGFEPDPVQWQALGRSPTYAEGSGHLQYPGYYTGEQGLLSTSALERPYDSAHGEATSTMSQRKRGKQPMRGSGAMGRATPKRGRSEETLGSAKRLRVGGTEQERYMSPAAYPGPSGHSGAQDMPPINEIPEDLANGGVPRPQPEGAATGEPEHRPLVITRHETEGRKLGLLGIARGELEDSKTPEDPPLSPRMTTIDVLETDESGRAVLATREVLETELTWLDPNNQMTPPSSPKRMSFQTPVAPRKQAPKEEEQTDEENSEPALKREANQLSKRLQAFTEAMTHDEQPLVSTRIEMFGRVAVRKSTASSFLQLSSSQGSAAIEEIKADGKEDWEVESDESRVFRPFVRPMWPDNEAPWALAGGKMKDRIRREEGAKAHTLRRYLETSSDESEEEDEHPRFFRAVRQTGHWGRGKGKSISRLLPMEMRERERRMDRTSARDALLSSLRSRPVPILPAGVVACVCGATAPNELGSMISCAACRTWHHLICNEFEDVAKVGPNWWCQSCTANASGLRTPVSHTPTRSYSSIGDPRSSAVKSDIDHIALAPSPMFVNSGNISAARTPVTRNPGSSPQRPKHSRVLSFGGDMWAFQEDAAPSTPVPVVHDRYSTPRISDTPFDVTSTPSRHLDFNFGQPSLFSLTPLGGRSRIPSTVLIDGTPVMRATPRNASGHGGALEPMSVPSRADFFRELNKGGNGPHSAGPSLGHHHSNAAVHHMAGSASVGTGDRELPVSPRWPHSLLGAQLSPSPFGGGHRRSLSGNKLSSMRSSSRSGLGTGYGVAEEKDE
ncbi:hypothetical protein B9479_002495 [Cryptococcus floricola]|uniref:Zinc finger PHD-type domain-containing protein n=1 Tax=Cryptococcus floricola TaxID=2591691 RepID=A0A5D3AZE9_9TREE|nr:hypothetical protein B9479_002495 [Cryptococcus floricola]